MSLEEQNRTSQRFSQPIIDANILKLRLDTSSTLEHIELFLRGSRVVYNQNPQTGKIEQQIVQLGIPKANDNGIQGLLNWITCTLNPHTVQGNFPLDKSGNSPKYDAYIEEYHTQLTKLLINNCYNWEILDDEIDGIIDFIMLAIMPYMTRLIDNKERESYNDSLKMGESHTIQNKPKGLSSLIGG